MYTRFAGHFRTGHVGQPHAGPVEDDRLPAERHVLVVDRGTARVRRVAGVVQDAVHVAAEQRSDETIGHVSGHDRLEKGSTRKCLSRSCVGEKRRRRNATDC